MQNVASEEAQENPGGLFSYSFFPREDGSQNPSNEEFRREGAYKEVSPFSRER